MDLAKPRIFNNDSYRLSGTLPYTITIQFCQTIFFHFETREIKIRNKMMLEK